MRRPQWTTMAIKLSVDFGCGPPSQGLSSACDAIGAKLRRNIGSNLLFEATGHVEHHFTDYQLTDRVSGATGKIGSHTPLGVSLMLAYSRDR